MNSLMVIFASILLLCVGFSHCQTIDGLKLSIEKVKTSKPRVPRDPRQEPTIGDIAYKHLSNLEDSLLLGSSDVSVNVQNIENYMYTATLYVGPNKQ
jgi:hypothetical protein